LPCLSDELSDYPELDSALNGALIRARKAGKVAMRRWGYDPDQIGVIKRIIRQKQVD